MKKNIYDTLYLDRDGVINHKINGYVQNYSQLRYIPGVLTSISKLSKYFERIFVITNQQGIGKKIMTINELNELHSKMLIDVREHGGRIDKIYFCPHLESIECDCRKPKPGMFIKSKSDFPDLDFSKAIMIGDSDSDIEAAERLNIIAYKVSDKFTLSNWTDKFLYN